MRSVLWLAVGCACAGTGWAQSPVAQPPSATAPAAMHAAGYQPDWTLDIAGGTLTLSTHLQLQEPPPKVQAAITAAVRAQAPATTASPATLPSTSSDSLRYTASTAKGELQARFVPVPCTDSIQGSLHPYSVEVSLAGSRFTGCGGDPAALLQSRVWVVEDIAARGVIDRSRITLQFGTAGEVSGRASCSLLEGRYQTTGNSLRLSVSAKTPPAKSASEQAAAAPSPQGVVPATKICPPALRRQDAAFFEVLNAVARWDFTADGALALGTADGQRVVARRE